MDIEARHDAVYNTIEDFIDQYPDEWEKSSDEELRFLLHSFSEKRYLQNPKNIDLVCVYAAAKEYIWKDDDAIELLKNFINENKQTLTDKDFIRIYTNISTLYRSIYDDENEILYLEKAISYGPIYPNPYFALGYASQFTDSLTYAGAPLSKNNTEGFQKAERYYRQAWELLPLDKILYTYATTLFMNRKYFKARRIFTDLLEEYPQDPAVISSLIACETKIGNKKKALKLLDSYQKLEKEFSYNFFTENHEITETTYFLLEEYEQYIKYTDTYDDYPKIIVSNFHDNDVYISNYFYALKTIKTPQEFEKIVQTHVDNMHQQIKEIINDDVSEYDSLEDKEIYLQDAKETLEKFLLRIEKIRNGTYKPEYHYFLMPYRSCCAFDCFIMTMREEY